MRHVGMCYGKRRWLTWESADHENVRTDIACDVYVERREPDPTSKMYIWPVSVDSATLEPSGLCESRLVINTSRKIYLGDRLTYLQCIPNLVRPLDSVACLSPKLAASAEWMVTLPDPPVDAYVPPLGLRDTDHAVRISTR